MIRTTNPKPLNITSSIDILGGQSPEVSVGEREGRYTMYTTTSYRGVGGGVHEVVRQGRYARQHGGNTVKK